MSQKNDAARITKLDIEMLYKSWKPIYFVVKVMSHMYIAGLGLCTLVIAGFF